MNNQPNHAFYRALHSLTHPVTIAAVVLLLVNDHWLRHTYPSWLTGKLGDFTWLVFAPFIAALLFAWLIPRRIANHERIVGLTAFTFIGLWFAMAKTIPIIHHVTTTALESITGWQGTLRLDATDLLTLPALLIGWWIWTYAANRPVNLRPLVYVALALGIVGTLATSVYEPIPNNGVIQICEQDGMLFVDASVYRTTFNRDGEEELGAVFAEVFVSTDGGLSWESANLNIQLPDTCANDNTHTIHPDNPQIQYRWVRGEYIERSTNGGQTWTQDYHLIELQQDVRRYYNHYISRYSDPLDYVPSPVAGVIHSQTGNLVLAMSRDGILVRIRDGVWQWVAVGNYQLADIHTFNRLDSLLLPEIWLMIMLIFLLATTSIAYIRRGSVQVFMLMLGWIGWIFLLLYLVSIKPDVQTGLLSEFFFWDILGIVLLVFIVIPLSLAALIDIARNFRHVAHYIFIVAIGTGGVFILPFILWTQGRIPPYNIAFLFSLLLTAAALYSGSLHLRRVLPPPHSFKEKRKRQPELETDES